MVMAKRMLYLARKLLEEAERLLAGLGGEHGNPILIEIVNKDNLEIFLIFLQEFYLICVWGARGGIVVAAVHNWLAHLIAPTTVGLLQKNVFSSLTLNSYFFAAYFIAPATVGLLQQKKEVNFTKLKEKTRQVYFEENPAGLLI